MNSGYTDIKYIIEKIKQEGFEDIHETDIKEYTWDIVGLIATPALFENVVADIDIEDYRGTLPIDFYMLEGIRDKETQIPYRKNTSRFHKVDRPNSLGTAITQTYTAAGDEPTSFVATTHTVYDPEEYVYMMERGVIFVPQEETTLEISYKSFPIYDDLTPKIPDDPKIVRAIIAFIIMKLAKKMVLKKTMDRSTYEMLAQDYSFAVGAARSKLAMGTVEDLENFKNKMLDIVPRPLADRQSYKHMGGGRI